MFLAVHKGYCCQDHGSHVPTRSPSLLMEISERGANRFADLKSPARSEEHQLRRGKGILLTQLQQTMVVSARIRSVKSE